MCPVEASIALGAVTAISGYQGQKQAAKAQALAQAQQSKAENQRLTQQQSAARINQRFQMEQSAAEMQKAALKAREAQATARVSAAESGVAGTSVDALMDDLTRKQAIYNFGMTRQLEQSNYATELQLRDNSLGSAQRQLAINKPIEQPDLLGNLLRGASTGMSAYGGLKQ